MTPQKHPLSWFTERVGKTVITEEGKTLEIGSEDQAKNLFKYWQQDPHSYRDPHPLTASILTCSVISCDACGKVGTTEDLDKEIAAKGFEGEGWTLDKLGMVHCGCKK